MISFQDRMKLKRGQVDSWTVKEKLSLASAVLRSGDQNWMTVSRSLKALSDDRRPADWFSQKNCAVQYASLLENVNVPKRKKRAKAREPYLESSNEIIIRRLTQERVEELRRLLNEDRKAYAKLKDDVVKIKNGTVDDKLDEIYQEIEKEKKEKTLKAEEHRRWLKDRRTHELAKPWKSQGGLESLHQRKCYVQFYNDKSSALVPGGESEKDFHKTNSTPLLNHNISILNTGITSQSATSPTFGNVIYSSNISGAINESEPVLNTVSSKLNDIVSGFINVNQNNNAPVWHPSNIAVGAPALPVLLDLQPSLYGNPLAAIPCTPPQVDIPCTPQADIPCTVKVSALNSMNDIISGGTSSETIPENFLPIQATVLPVTTLTNNVETSTQINREIIEVQTLPQTYDTAGRTKQGEGTVILQIDSNEKSVILHELPRENEENVSNDTVFKELDNNNSIITVKVSEISDPVVTTDQEDIMYNSNDDGKFSHGNINTEMFQNTEILQISREDTFQISAFDIYTSSSNKKSAINELTDIEVFEGDNNVNETNRNPSKELLSKQNNESTLEVLLEPDFNISLEILAEVLKITESQDITIKAAIFNEYLSSLQRLKKCMAMPGIYITGDIIEIGEDNTEKVIRSLGKGSSINLETEQSDYSDIQIEEIEYADLSSVESSIECEKERHVCETDGSETDLSSNSAFEQNNPVNTVFKNQNMIFNSDIVVHDLSYNDNREEQNTDISSSDIVTPLCISNATVNTKMLSQIIDSVANKVLDARCITNSLDYNEEILSSDDIEESMKYVTKEKNKQNNIISSSNNEKQMSLCDETFSNTIAKEVIEQDINSISDNENISAMHGKRSAYEVTASDITQNLNKQDNHSVLDSENMLTTYNERSVNNRDVMISDFVKETVVHEINSSAEYEKMLPFVNKRPTNDIDHIILTNVTKKTDEQNILNSVSNNEIANDMQSEDDIEFEHNKLCDVTKRTDKQDIFNSLSNNEIADGKKSEDDIEFEHITLSNVAKKPDEQDILNSVSNSEIADDKKSGDDIEFEHNKLCDVTKRTDEQDIFNSLSNNEIADGKKSEDDIEFEHITLSNVAKKPDEQDINSFLENKKILTVDDKRSANDIDYNVNDVTQKIGKQDINSLSVNEEVLPLGDQRSIDGIEYITSSDATNKTDKLAIMNSLPHLDKMLEVVNMSSYGERSFTNEIVVSDEIEETCKQNIVSPLSCYEKILSSEKPANNENEMSFNIVEDIASDVTKETVERDIIHSLSHSEKILGLSIKNADDERSVSNITKEKVDFADVLFRNKDIINYIDLTTMKDNPEYGDEIAVSHDLNMIRHELHFQEKSETDFSINISSSTTHTNELELKSPSMVQINTQLKNVHSNDALLKDQHEVNLKQTNVPNFIISQECEAINSSENSIQRKRALQDNSDKPLEVNLIYTDISKTNTNKDATETLISSNESPKEFVVGNISSQSNLLQNNVVSQDSQCQASIVERVCREYKEEENFLRKMLLDTSEFMKRGYSKHGANVSSTKYVKKKSRRLVGRTNVSTDKGNIKDFTKCTSKHGLTRKTINEDVQNKDSQVTPKRRRTLDSAYSPRRQYPLRNLLAKRNADSEEIVAIPERSVKEGYCIRHNIQGTRQREFLRRNCKENSPRKILPKSTKLNLPTSKIYQQDKKNIAEENVKKTSVHVLPKQNKNNNTKDDVVGRDTHSQPKEGKKLEMQNNKKRKLGGKLTKKILPDTSKNDEKEILFISEDNGKQTVSENFKVSKDKSQESLKDCKSDEERRVTRSCSKILETFTTKHNSKICMTGDKKKTTLPHRYFKENTSKSKLMKTTNGSGEKRQDGREDANKILTRSQSKENKIHEIIDGKMKLGKPHSVIKVQINSKRQITQSEERKRSIHGMTRKVKGGTSKQDTSKVPNNEEVMPNNKSPSHSKYIKKPNCRIETDKRNKTDRKIKDTQKLNTHKKFGKNTEDKQLTQRRVNSAINKNWKKSIMLLFEQIASHKYASLFLRPITDYEAPGYSAVVHSPMDLSTIKRNIEIGVIRSTKQFKHYVMLMFSNALLYNECSSLVYKMTQEMQCDVVQYIQDFIAIEMTVEESDHVAVCRKTRNTDKRGKTIDCSLAYLNQEKRQAEEKRLCAASDAGESVKKKMKLQ